MRFELIVLGTSGGAPTSDRNCSGYVLRTEATDVPIDCGENTQRQLLRAGLGMGKVSHVLISHLHGDHYFGLAPLLSSLAMQGRTAALTIVSPLHLRPRLNALLELDTYGLPFPLHFVTLAADGPTPVARVGDLDVVAFPLRHRIATNGYLLRERARPANVRKEAIAEYRIPWPQIRDIKAGADLTLADGRTIPHAELTTPAAPARSLAYCCDTVYFPELADYVAGVDLLVHDATFRSDMADDAAKKGHSTARQAAQTARAAGAGRLILTHFSARYDGGADHEREAREVFAATDAARDLCCYTVPFVGRAD